MLLFKKVISHCNITFFLTTDDGYLSPSTLHEHFLSNSGTAVAQGVEQVGCSVLCPHVEVLFSKSQSPTFRPVSCNSNYI